MTTPFDTVRELLQDMPPTHLKDKALTALAAIEADHLTSADIASAAAQGVRDGVASVTAGQEPVKWMCTETKVLYDHDTSEVDKYHGFKPTVPLYAAPVAQQQKQDWRELARKAGFRVERRSGLPDTAPEEVIASGVFITTEIEAFVGLLSLQTKESNHE